MLFVVYEPPEWTNNTMIYGHIDKQPHLDGWMEGTGPTTPAVINGWLYGWGSSDDCYVPFASLLAIKSALDAGEKLQRVVIVLETEEESGSKDLLYLLWKNRDIIKDVDACICMDSGCLDYDSIWLTSTLWGVVNFDLEVEIATQGTHSGLAGGILPDTWRIINNLIERVEDPLTGKISALELDIPPYFYEEAKIVAEL